MRSDGVLFVERANELAVRRLAKPVTGGAIVKARVNSPKNWCRTLDPKPGELFMARLKFR